MTFRLTRQAEEDIIGIYVDGIAQFGMAQADAYHQRLEATLELIAEQPYIARLPTEIQPAVRVHPHGSHIIIYQVIREASVLIVRVRHASEDWHDDPTGRN